MNRRQLLTLTAAAIAGLLLAPLAAWARSHRHRVYQDRGSGRRGIRP